MRKSTLRGSIIISLFLLTISSFADHVPFNHPDRKTTFALQQDLRVFWKVSDNFKLLFEGQIKESLTDNTTANHLSANQSFPEILAFRIGVLYRVHRNIKVGAYYQLYNRRNHHTGNLNSEHIPMIDIIPRLKLGGNFVAEIRLRNEFNLYSKADQSRKSTLWYAIKIRPKITYFHNKDAEFKFATFLAYEIYIPVNYDKYHMEHWIYAGFTIPIAGDFSISPYYALIIHRESSDHTGGVTHLFGLGMIFNF